MNPSLCDIHAYRVWAVLPLVGLAWHGCHTAAYSHPHNLFFVCYPANLLLGIGILVRSGLLTGTGGGWTTVALPLWLHYAVRTSDWTPSGIAFHLGGFIAGILSARYHCFPRFTWIIGIGFGAAMQLAARLCTRADLNVNAAFRVYEGWENVFALDLIYRFFLIGGFGFFFLLWTWLNRRFLYREAGRP